jgi:hypothetical protein
VLEDIDDFMTVISPLEKAIADELQEMIEAN